MSPRPVSGPDADAVLRAAMALLDDEGPSALTVRAIGSAVGASSTVVYSRFGSADDLMAAIGVHALGEMVAALEAAVGRGDPREDLLAMARAYHRYAIDHPHRVALMLEPASSPEAFERAKGEAGLSMDRLAAPLVRAGHPDPTLATELLWAALHGLAEVTAAGFLDTTRTDDRLGLLVDGVLAAVS